MILFRRLSVLLTSCLLSGFLGCAYAASYDLPDLGDPNTQNLSLAEEQMLGQQFMQMVWQGLPLVYDPIVEDYINQLGEHLVTYSDASDRPFYFFVVKDLSINAFAGPGGYIGVNVGLILTAENESELAAVMSHEIAHITQRHVAQGLERGKATNLATLAGIAGSLLLGTQSAQLGAGALAATLNTAQQSMLSFSRSNEQEADRIGIDTLAGAGFDPDSMADFFGTMDRNSSRNDAPEFLQTHPLSQKRLSDALNHASGLKNNNASYRDSLLFKLIQARLRTDTFPDGRQALAYFNGQLKQSQGQQLIADQYGLALAFNKNQQYDLALKWMQSLEKSHPQQLLFDLGLAEIEMDQKSYTQALQRLARLHQLYPDNPVITQQYAHSALKANQNATAIRLYRLALRKDQDNPVLYIGLSRAYSRENELGEAYMARSRFYELLGNKSRATSLLNQALKYTQNQPDTTAVINARLQILADGSP